MFTVLLTATATGAAPAAAGHPHSGSPRLAQAAAPPVEVSISAGEAAAIAASRTGGRVLDVQLQGGRRPHYRVRILLGGERVRTVTVDAVTGEFRG